MRRRLTGPRWVAVASTTRRLRCQRATSPTRRSPPQHPSALPTLAAETYTAHPTDGPAVQGNQVYPTPCTTVPSISIAAASDKRCSLGLTKMTTTHRTAEEAKAEHIRLMGDELGTIYAALWQEVAWVHGKWSEFVALFGTRESRVDLLNAAAPAFCGLVQDSIWENVLLHVARLTDRPGTGTGTGKKQNLTIQRLPMLIDRVNARATVETKVQAALASCAFARDWRNRHIAHSDLDLKVSDTAQPLEFASRQCVNQALASLSDVLNTVAAEYLDSTSFFDTLDGDALALLYVIDDGLRADKQRRERLRKGIYDPEEFKQRDV